jgi:hypothetical protein
MPVDSEVGQALAVVNVVGGTAPFSYEIIENSDNLFTVDNMNGMVYQVLDHSGNIGDEYTLGITITDFNGLRYTLTHTFRVCEDRWKYSTHCIQGNQDMYLQMPCDRGYTFNPTMTISIYAYYMYSDDKQYLYSIGNADNTLVLGLFVRSGKLYCEHYNSSTNAVIEYEFQDIPTERWQHIIFSKDVDAKEYKCILNIDQSTITHSFSDNIPIPPPALVGCGLMGRDYYRGHFVTAGQSWQGMMGFVSIFDAILSAVQLNGLRDHFGEGQHHYVNNIHPKLFYKMGEGDAYANIKDHVKGNDAVLVNTDATCIVRHAPFYNRYMFTDGIDGYYKSSNLDGSKLSALFDSPNTLGYYANVDFSDTPFYPSWLVNDNNSANEFKLWNSYPTDGVSGVRDYFRWKNDADHEHTRYMNYATYPNKWQWITAGMDNTQSPAAAMLDIDCHHYANAQFENTLVYPLFLSSTTYTWTLAYYTDTKLMAFIVVDKLLTQDEMCELGNYIHKNENIYCCPLLDIVNI